MVQRVVTNQGVVLLPFVTSQREYFFQNCFCTRQAKSEACRKIQTFFFCFSVTFLNFYVSFQLPVVFFMLLCVMWATQLGGPPVFLGSPPFICHLFVGPEPWGTCVAGHNLSRLIIGLKSCLDSRSIPDLILLFFLCLSWVKGRKCVSSAGLRLWGIANGILRCYGTHVPADSR